MGVVLKKRKWEDIQNLLRFVPPIHHKFFNHLHEGISGDTNELYPDESEEEEFEDE